MCLAIVHFDPQSPYEFVMLETRDENVHRLHGLPALAAAGRKGTCSYGAHWRTPEALQGLPVLHGDPSAVLEADIVGGFDEGRGTWVALSLRNGIAAKLLVAELPGGGLGEAHNPLVSLGPGDGRLVTRTGLCLAACAFASAEDAADGMPGLLRESFGKDGIEMLPFRLVFGGPTGAYVLHYESPASLTVTALPERSLVVVSTLGINDQRSKITGRLLRMLDAAQARPDPRLDDGWDGWVRACSFANVFSDHTARAPAVPYRDPAWRAFEHSVYQPPYVAGHGANSHRRPLGPGTREAPIEWTCSSTCIALSSRLPPKFLAEERPPLGDFASLPDRLAGIRFPASTRDFSAVVTARSVSRHPVRGRIAEQEVSRSPRSADPRGFPRTGPRSIA